MARTFRRNGGYLCSVKSGTMKEWRTRAHRKFRRRSRLSLHQGLETEDPKSKDFDFVDVDLSLYQADLDLWWSPSDGKLRPRTEFGRSKVTPDGHPTGFFEFYNPYNF